MNTVMYMNGIGFIIYCQLTKLWLYKNLVENCVCIESSSMILIYVYIYCIERFTCFGCFYYIENSACYKRYSIFFPVFTVGEIN